jgi:undecaprenyl-diphosphatase
MDLILLLKALILGLVEGVTEFLPISSTGHLIIAGDLLNFNDEKGKIFEIVIQLGAILAVCWAYRAKIGQVLATTNQKSSQQLIINLGLAFLPAALLGLAFHHQIKHYLFSPITVACALIVGGIAILIIERIAPQPNIEAVDDMDWKHALKIGFAQTVALIPGVSRSGATILGGVLFGLSRSAATEFSFFLAIPIMFAATAFELLSNRALFSWQDVDLFAVGFVTAFISALLVIKLFIRYVAKHDFTGFAWYRIIFGIIVLAYYW